MKKSQFTEEQIAYTLREVEAGTPATEICRKLGVSEQTVYRWKKTSASMGVAELRRLKQLEVDSGPEFTSKALDEWAARNKVKLEFSCPGTPTDNP